jgi:hypothetical protein
MKTALAALVIALAPLAGAAARDLNRPEQDGARVCFNMPNLQLRSAATVQRTANTGDLACPGYLSTTIFQARRRLLPT